MVKQKKKWLAGVIAGVLTVSMLGCGANKDPNGTSAAGTTGTATQAATQGEGEKVDLASLIRGNTNPTDEEIALVNTTLDDSYLGDFYGLGSDYSAYDGRFDGVTLDIWFPNLHGTATVYADLGEHPAFKLVEELTGIKLNFITPTVGEEKTEFNLMLSGKELPDIIFNWAGYYSGGMIAGLEDGLIIDLKEYEDKLPNYMKYINEGPYSDNLPQNTVNDSGNRLAVYELRTGLAGVTEGPMVKTAAMKKAGWTELPETIDEWHDFLTDCKNAGYDVPLIFGSTTGFATNGHAFISSAYGVFQDLFVDENGKVAYGPVQEGLEGYLETMRQWYEEGLIDKAFATGDYDHRKSMTASDDSAVIINAPQNVADLAGLKLGEEVIALPYPVLNKGDQPKIEAVLSYTGNSASITTQCDNVEAALAFLDFGFSKKGWEIYGLGAYGDVHLIDEEGRPYYQEDSLVYTDEEIKQYGSQYLLSKYRLHHFTCAYWDMDSHPSQDTKVNIEICNNWADTGKLMDLPSVTLTPEETSELARIATDINSTRNEYLLKIITGQRPLSDTEEFRQKVKDIGLDTYLKVYQAAYDRYLAR